MQLDCMSCCYYACMSKSITVRDVPDQTSTELAARAAASGRSLQEYLRDRLIELAATPDADQFVRTVRARKLATGTHVTVARILDDRDADRR